MKRKLTFTIAMLCIPLLCMAISAKKLLSIHEKKDQKWSIVDEKGKVLLKEYFNGYVTQTQEGTFAVRDSDGIWWSVYSIEKKNKPHLIADGLASIGNFSEGVMAVIRVNGQPIEIIDKHGKTILTLDTICGKAIARCGYCHYGRFVVTTIDKMGKVNVGMVDRQGKVIVEPEYEELYACANGSYCGRRLSKDKTHTEIVIPDGKGGFSIRSSDMKIYRIANHAILPFEDKTIILNLSDIEKRMVLPANITVEYIRGKHVSYSKNGEVFVYDGATKQTLSFPGSESVVLAKKGLLSVSYDVSDIPHLALFSLKGKFLRNLGSMIVESCNDFLITKNFNGDGKCLYNLLGDRFRLMLKNDCEDINYFCFPAIDTYEYSPIRPLDYKFAFPIFKENLRMMADLGAVAGRNRKDCPLESMELFYMNNQSFTRTLFENEDGVITESFISFYDIGDISDINIMFLTAGVLVEMDKMFHKVSDNVYEDNGVFYHLEKYSDAIVIYISDSSDRKSF